MSDLAIEVKELSKVYRLGSIGTGSLKEDFQHWWQKSVLKKEHSFFKLEEEAARMEKKYLWALQDISFDVKIGEAVGIIGANGSGKSTLLKIISRIVQPTKGSVRGRGKISSILEVGTGFHQDLTGRENIFTSGYTLGMNKQEIRNKFDEIVSFSGIEKFLDTPVKRYSSGMYVRLAFAVAAHLEPDILIVDEVLAVGDADFQKKCMGKMQQVSNKEGRTILFVSHNLQAIANLCTQAIWLNKGIIEKTGQAAAVVKTYIGSTKKDKPEQAWETPDSAPGNDMVKLKSARIQPQSDEADAFITVKTPIQLDFEFWCYVTNMNLNVNVKLLTSTGECVFNLGTVSIQAQKAVVALTTIIPANLLNNATYSISLTVVKNNATPIYEFANCITFDVEDLREGIPYFGKWQGIIRPQIDSYLYVKDLLEYQ